MLAGLDRQMADIKRSQAHIGIRELGGDAVVILLY